jgi:hypothetical protein
MPSARSGCALGLLLLATAGNFAFAQADEPGSAKPPTPAAPSAAPAGAAGAAPSGAKPLVDYPHPLITEVLFAVPTGSTGDANQDGTRDATGDEFVELVNPHDKPINLRGYRLVDKSLGKGNALSFTFPDCTLQPGEVAVVFNGYKATIPGPTGDSGRAAESNPKFGNARVFSMKGQSTKTSFSNTADAVLLFAPGMAAGGANASAVQIVRWGKVDALPASGLNEEASATSKGSVQRESMTGPLAVHPPEGGVSFSPGKFGFGSAPKPDASTGKPGETKVGEKDKGGSTKKPATKSPASKEHEKDKNTPKDRP